MGIRDLIGYNHTVRRLYLASFAKLPWVEVVEPRGASFDFMRDVFLHLTLVEDRWINYAIPDRFSLWVDPVFGDFKDRIPEKLCAFGGGKNTKLSAKADA